MTGKCQEAFVKLLGLDRQEGEGELDTDGPGTDID